MKNKVTIEDFDEVNETTIVKNGNGACAMSLKKHLGKKATLIIGGQTK